MEENVIYISVYRLRVTDDGPIPILLADYFSDVAPRVGEKLAMGETEDVARLWLVDGVTHAIALGPAEDDDENGKSAIPDRHMGLAVYVSRIGQRQ